MSTENSSCSNSSCSNSSPLLDEDVKFASIKDRNAALLALFKSEKEDELKAAQKQLLELIGKPTVEEREAFMAEVPEVVKEYFRIVTSTIDEAIKEDRVVMQPTVRARVAPDDVAKGTFARSDIKLVNGVEKEVGQIWKLPAGVKYSQSAVAITRKQYIRLLQDKRVLKVLGLSTSFVFAVFVDLIVTPEVYNIIQTEYELDALGFTEEFYKSTTGEVPYTEIAAKEPTKVEAKLGILAYIGVQRLNVNAAAARNTVVKPKEEKEGVISNYQKFEALLANSEDLLAYIFGPTEVLRVIDA